MSKMNLQHIIILLSSGSILISHSLPSYQPKTQNSPRIINGQDPEDGQLHFAAAITYQTADNSFFCGGTIFRPQWIITAGQCVNNAVKLTIRIGSVNRVGDDGETHESTEYYLPPEFTVTPLMNDIALIKITPELVYGDNITPVWFVDSIGNGYPFPTLIFGWGTTSDSNSDFSPTLKWAYVDVLTTEECKATYGDQITDEKMCALGPNNEGTCLGDSGTGLIQYPDPDWTVIIGVSSFLSQEGCENYPSGFTRVYPFNQWILNHTNNAVPPQM